MTNTVNGILVPAQATVDRYGMVMSEWDHMIEEQGYVCGCCEKKPGSGRLFIDHEHVKGWKHLPPDERKKYVRGLVCYVCNRFILNHRVNAKILRQGAAYLERYNERRLKEEV